MADLFEVPPILQPPAKGVALEHVRAYFLGNDRDRPYAGAQFESIGHSWSDDRYVNIVTPSDLLALGTLSTPLKKYSSGHLLGADFQHQASALLRLVPPRSDIDDPDAAALLADDSPASQLYDLVRNVPGMGPVRASKLLARKRPGLIPIRDQNVEKALDASHAVRWWKPYRGMVTAGEVPPITIAADIHRELKLSALITPLRVIDAILWRSVESPDGDASDSEDEDV